MPLVDHNALGSEVSVRYGPDGLLYAWDGFRVLRQNAANAGDFTAIGTIIAGLNDPGWAGPGYTGPYNSADPGPISFSGDGQRLLLGNGEGGFGAYRGATVHRGRVWEMPAGGGTVSIPAGQSPVGIVRYHWDFLPVPAACALPNTATKWFLDQGTLSRASSSVSVFDDTTGQNVPVIVNMPGASASMALGPDDRLYTNVGYGTERGVIRSFSLADLATAYSRGSPLDFGEGRRFNPLAADNQSGLGMFFDARGRLYSGGDEGITCFLPNPDPSVGAMVSTTVAMNRASVAYNPVADQVLAVSDGTGTVYHARDFAPLSAVWTGTTEDGNWTSTGNWGGVQVVPTMDLTFGPLADGGRTVTNDFYVGTWFNALIFAAGAPTYHLEGNALALTSAVANHSSSPQHLDLTDLTLLRGGGTFDADGADLYVRGDIDGAAPLKKTGPHRLVLSGINSYTGGTIVSEGALEIETADAVPPGGSLVIDGGAKLVFPSGLILSGGSAVHAATARSTLAPAAVPEPGTLLLLLAACAAGWICRRATSRRTSGFPA
jgi:autotransporter-associated beta strand protein